MPRTYQRTGLNIDPNFTRERARKAGQASHSVDSYIRRLVDAAPKLTPEQRDRLATLLRATPDDTGRPAA
jgi:hypothetical protein